MGIVMSNINWNTDVWDIIDSYFKNTDNYLAKHQIDSYNSFLKDNIPKTVRQFNPIELPYYQIGDSDEYLFDIKITLGGEIDNEYNVINSGKGIYIGKPVIQELQRDEDNENEIYINQKTLFPNEARLKNLTYKTEFRVDVIVEILVNDTFEEIGEKKKKRNRSTKTGLEYKSQPNINIKPIIFKKIPLGYIPVMLRSKICNTSILTNKALRATGECEYDHGGYFIIDGKEKVIVAQERQIENKIYTNKKPKDA